jgi:hypothetical protein
MPSQTSRHQPFSHLTKSELTTRKSVLRSMKRPLSGLFTPELLTTHLPWQDRAVLLGPYHPSVTPTQWYVRRPRTSRRASPERKDYPESILRCSVPIPIKNIRRLLAALHSKIERILISPLQQGLWKQGFNHVPTSYKQADGFWYYSINLFDPMLELKLGKGLSAAHDAQLAPWLSARQYAKYWIQLLRETSYRNGGWWPAPYLFEVRVFADTGRLRLGLWFVPHYMSYQRQVIYWPHTPMELHKLIPFEQTMKDREAISAKQKKANQLMAFIRGEKAY